MNAIGNTKRREVLNIVVGKLLGEVTPIGRSEVDAERLENLELLLDFHADLTQEINNLLRYSDSYESSVKIIGQKAEQYLESFSEEWNLNQK